MENKFLKDFSEKDIEKGYESMIWELDNAPKWIIELFVNIWIEFTEGKFSYDGATFVPERYSETPFEVASFIHDYFNHIGYVGKNVDKLFIIIMKTLNYDKFDILLRKVLMNFTFLNVLIHKIDKNKLYLGDINIKNYTNDIQYSNRG